LGRDSNPTGEHRRTQAIDDVPEPSVGVTVALCLLKANGEETAADTEESVMSGVDPVFLRLPREVNQMLDREVYRRRVRAGGRRISRSAVVAKLLKDYLLQEPMEAPFAVPDK